MECLIIKIKIAHFWEQGEVTDGSAVKYTVRCMYTIV